MTHSPGPRVASSGARLTSFRASHSLVNRAPSSARSALPQPSHTTTLCHFLSLDAAVEQLKKTLDSASDFWFAHAYLGRAYGKLGRMPEAIAELQKAEQLSGGLADTWSGLGVAYARQGEKAKAREILERLKAQTDPYVPPYSVAALYANLGENDHAFEYLQKAYEQGSFYMSVLKIDPELDSLRSDPRFTELLRKMGLQQ